MPQNEQHPDIQITGLLPYDLLKELCEVAQVQKISAWELIIKILKQSVMKDEA